jgi:PPM family protein phosphatase
VELSHAYETTNIRVDQLDPSSARSVQQGLGAGSLDEAQRTVQRLADNQRPQTSSSSAGGG